MIWLDTKNAHTQYSFAKYSDRLTKFQTAVKNGAAVKSMMMKLPKVLTVYSCIDVIRKRDCKYNTLILHQYSIKHSKLLLLSFYCLNFVSQKQTRSRNGMSGNKFMVREKYAGELTDNLWQSFCKLFHCTFGCFLKLISRLVPELMRRLLTVGRDESSLSNISFQIECLINWWNRFTSSTVKLTMTSRWTRPNTIYIRVISRLDVTGKSGRRISFVF